MRFSRAHAPRHTASSLIVASLVAASTALAAPSGPPAEDEARPHETRGDAVLVTPPPLPRSPRAIIQHGAFTSIQVNVDGSGLNIVGDAGNEPSIAVDPTIPNRMAVGWRQFDTISSNFRQAGWSFSRDGGRTWAGQQKIEPGIFRSDPVLASGPSGTFYYLSLEVSPQNDFLCDLFVSTDGGETWPAKWAAFGGDKAWIAVDPATLNLYQAWNVAGNMFFPAQFNRGLDAGASWESPVVYDPLGDPPARPVFGLVAIGPEGEVYVAGARNSSNSDQFWVVRSSNADGPDAPTFDQIVEIDMGGNLILGEGPNPAGLLGQVNIAVDTSGGPRHGWVYVLSSVDPQGSDPLDVHFIRSTDGGLTWSDPVRVNDDSGPTAAWQWFGQMSVAPNGRIDAIWNDTRNGSETVSQLYHASSEDGGETWSQNVSVSPLFDSHIGWPQQNKLGDYYDMVSDLVGADVIYAATFNGEQDVYYLRIGDYDCNGNGIGDADDLVSGAADDCDGDGIPDSCQIAAGTATDANGNGIIDACECVGDVNGDGAVNVDDLLLVLAMWGDCPAPCPADLDGDGDVDVDDLLGVLAAWGTCV